ncbi:MAG TPA: M24 family metallopeptidase [Solimonas sp.]
MTPASASAIWRPNADALEGFRTAQRLAYQCAETIGAELHEGMTEREVARRMRTFLRDHGADDCFHEPFAWFGDRTAFKGFVGFKHLGGFNPAFYPTGRRLQADMPYILDCAPTVKGYTADIGYCGVLGENRVLDRLMDDLREYRALILEKVRARDTLAEVSRAVDRLCARHGYEPRHKAYPFEVLAHRVETLSDDGRAHPSLARFGVRNITELLRGVLKGRDEGWSPLWSSGARSEHAPTPGLWAVEPHLGFRGVGAKFEELLVVTEDDAYWLDDDVPHVRRWIERGLWPQAEIVRAAA